MTLPPEIVEGLELERATNGHAPLIDGSVLLDEISTFMRRFVVLPSREAEDLLALWVLHTHALDAANYTPYIRLVSAAPASGKTRVFEVLKLVVRDGWHAINPSTAVLFRKISKHQPTLLLDEMDNYGLEERTETLAVLNDGYKRGGTVDRCAAKTNELESFEVFCPKAYAGLDSGSLPDTLLSRSVTIRLQRRLRTDKLEMLIGPRIEPEATILRAKLARWADEHVPELDDWEPQLPAGIEDRAAEVWWSILSLAEFVAGEWPSRARNAARVLSAGGDGLDEDPERVRILADTFAVSQTAGGTAIFTRDLLEKLNEPDEWPWKSKRRGEGLDARGLGRLLRPYGVTPRTVRVGDDTNKGYQWDLFIDPWSRYLPEPSQASQASQLSADAERDVTDVTDVTANQERGA